MSYCNIPGCQRLCYVSGGVEHDYCGRTHANEVAKRGGGAPLASPHGRCHVCQLPGCDEPVFYEPEIQRVHDFCSRDHADQAIARGIHPTSNRPTQSEPDVAMRCALLGCSARCYVEPATGHVHDYCGRTHAKAAQARGIVPPPTSHFQAAGQGAFNHTFGGRPGSDSEDYTISSLNKVHPGYTDIKAQFLQNWDAAAKGGAAPTIQRIWQIRNKPSCFSCFNQYKEEVARTSGTANVQRRFHGTTMKCSFGINEGQKPCSADDCAVCTIIERGFDLDKSRGGPLTSQFATLGGALRYGRGLYFSKTSSKSDDYGSESERTDRTGARVRCMFMCLVALGRELRTPAERLEEHQVSAQLKARGYGGTHDSVLGLTVAEGGALNYEENVVYDQRAAIPSYLVVYKLP